MRLPSVVALLASSLSVSVPIAPAVAHPGGLDVNGCHTNHRTGEYHCHRGPSPAASSVDSLLDRSGQQVFRNCAEARAAGVAPIREGQAGYSRRLDRDGDGVACE
jgi:Excalibur calcium-binding domain